MERYILLIFIFFGIVFYSSNPDNNQFHEYFKNQLTISAQQNGYTGALKVSNAIKSVTGYDAVEKLSTYLLSDATRDNYGFFSIYDVIIDGKEYTWVGVFNKFIPVDFN